MIKNLNIKALIFALLATVLFFACKRKYDSPPPRTVEDGKIYTIRQLKELYNNTIVRFPESASLFATVTADEKSGNFYKTIFIQDGTGALQLNLLTSGGVYRGDSVRVALKGTRLIYINGMFQLDSVSTDNNIFKQSAGKSVNPQTVTINDILSVSENMKGMLIRIDSVQFSCNDVGTTYADAVSFGTMNKNLEDCSGKKVIVRTSGYAKFAGTLVKKGKGSLTGILTVYNTTPQIYIRDLNDVQISESDADRCTGTSCNFYLRKNFEDNSITSGGWLNINEVGTTLWTTNSQGSQFGTYYAMCSNYNPSGSRPAAESWLISPTVDLTASVNPVLKFQNAKNFSGPDMEVLVSTNYTSGSPYTATWTPLAYTKSSGSFAWVFSQISLSAYKVSNLRVAFKYTGTTSQGATWEIDDIVISE